MISGSAETSFLIQEHLIKYCSFSQHFNNNNPLLLRTFLFCYCQQSLVGSMAIQLSVFETYIYPLIFWKLRAQKGSHFEPFFRGSQGELALVVVIFHPGHNSHW